MQEQAITFQAKMEQDRQKIEAEMSARLQQQTAQFQITLMQQNQLFQAELFKDEQVMFTVTLYPNDFIIPIPYYIYYSILL